MIYKDFKGEKISLLGMGNMRLPITNREDNATINKEYAQQIIDYVYAHGVNYFDTAYMYHNGQSELFVGEALSKYPRDSYYLADKMPGMMMLDGKRTVDMIFEDQLRKCRTDYFDFYLLHNMNENDIDIYESEQAGIIPYLVKQKEAGRIKHFGFSCHSKPETLRGFLDRHDCFEFVQIQLNYLDYDIAEAKEMYEIIAEHGLKVWVMEPCRGGRLASLGEEVDSMFKATSPDRTVASWAFRWVQSLPEVQVILSGMTEIEQAIDNIATFDHYEPFTDEEKETLANALDTFKKKTFIPCTKCHYCSECPMELPIPEIIDIYNDYLLSGNKFFFKSKINRLDEDKRPNNCIGCGNCETQCPQSIGVPEIMEKLTQLMDE